MARSDLGWYAAGLLALAFAVPAAAELPLALSATNRLPEARTSAPVTWGVPLAPEDAVTDPAQLDLLRGGSAVPVQMTPLARWGGAPSDSTRPIAWPTC